MFDEELKDVWKRSAAATLSRADIEALLQPAARRAGRALQGVVWTNTAMLSAGALLAAMNLRGYRGNATMQAVEGALLVVCGTCAALGLRLLAELRRIARADLPLVETVARRLACQERWFPSWMAVATVTPWLFALAINTWIDNEGGSYRLGHPAEFAAVTAVMLGITYASLRLSLGQTLRELRAVLHDLRAEALDETQDLEARGRSRKTRLVLGVVALVLAVLFTLGLWLALA